MASFAAYGDPASGVRATHLARGDVLDGKYRIEQTLAEGGFGIVARATQLQLERQVAIKYLRGEVLQHEALVAHFEREARLAAKLRSEHVVRVHDVGVDPSIGPYMVMELLEGSDLEALLESGPMAIDAAVDYLLQACEALAEAHELEIVHRDLKPANLFLAQRPRRAPILKIIDFGISNVVPRRGAGAWTARDESAAGTPAYMSPEQLSGEHVDARSDVWALGVVLFELLGRSMPFAGASTGEVCDAILGRAPARLSARRSDVPAALDAVVQRCLEKDPARRYQTVGELARALRPFGPSVKEEAAPVSASARRLVDPRAQSPTVVVARRRRPGRGALLATATLAAMLVVGAGVIVMRRTAKESAMVVTPAEPTAEAPPVPAEIAPATTAASPMELAAAVEPAATATAAPAATATDQPVAKPVPKPRGSEPRSGRSELFGGGRQ